MVTSANTTNYRVFDKEGNVVKEYSQNMYCESKHKELIEFKPYSDYEIQASGLDEHEAPWEGEREGLKKFLINYNIIKGLCYKDACELAEKRDKNVFSGRDLIKIILIKHFDGSILEFHDACYEEISEEEGWYAVYTEHHGFHVYHYQDIKSIEEVTKKVIYRS